MTLHSLRHRLGVWFGRPIGRLAALLLAAAMILPASGALAVHAHADGDQHHEHALQLAVDFDSDAADDNASSRAVEASSLHEHDLGTTASTLPEPQVLVLEPVVPIASVAYAAASPAPCLARTPPHRPPIA